MPLMIEARVMSVWAARKEGLLVQAVAAVCLATAAGAASTATSPDDLAPKPYVIRVGPQWLVTTIAEAATRARDGDIVEIEAGDYIRDVAVWTKSDLTIRAVNGPVRIIAAGASAEGKGTFVVRGDNVVVENLTFIGARSRDRNGAGIRLERGHLKVIGCAFLENENGILTGNNSATELEIENSEFGYNGAGDGQSHNLYVGKIGRLTVTGSYFHHANVGHLLKSRAQHNLITYNRFTDENGGRASYELEFPNGGFAYVVGNIIEQSATTENSTIVSFGAERYRWPRNELYLVNNTIIDDRPAGGTFLRVRPGADDVKAVDNILFGKGDLEATAGPGAYVANFVANFHARAADFASPFDYDYRLKRRSKLVGKAKDPGEANGVRLRPEREYVHPRGSRPVTAVPYSPGALQSLAR